MYETGSTEVLPVGKIARDEKCQTFPLKLQ
jgi:hypothetical protein